MNCFIYRLFRVILICGLRSGFSLLLYTFLFFQTYIVLQHKDILSLRRKSKRSPKGTIEFAKISVNQNKSRSHFITYPFVCLTHITVQAPIHIYTYWARKKSRAFTRVTRTHKARTYIYIYLYTKTHAQNEREREFSLCSLALGGASCNKRAAAAANCREATAPVKGSCRLPQASAVRLPGASARYIALPFFLCCMYMYAATLYTLYMYIYSIVAIAIRRRRIDTRFRQSQTRSFSMYTWYCVYV